MQFARFVTCPALAILAAMIPTASSASVLYTFGNSSGGWTTANDTLIPTAIPWQWTAGPNVNAGGWRAWRSIDPTDAGTYLISPCFVIDNDAASYVRMDIRHRFDFGQAANPQALGQVQYRINDGSWFGIRTSDFLSTSGKITPSYFPPPSPPFISTTLIPSGGPYNVEAWVGTTINFGTGGYADSQFTLDFDTSSIDPYPFVPGDEIQFRFLMGPLLDADPAVITWEINRVEIDGVNVCPEPNGMAIFLGGGLMFLFTVTRRKRILSRSLGAGSIRAARVTPAGTHKPGGG